MPANEQKTFEFIHNPNFVNWVLKPDDQSDHFWKTYQIENPEQKKELEHSRILIKRLVKDEKSLSEEEISELWKKIEHIPKSKNQPGLFH